jgi:hypothetical protein
MNFAHHQDPKNLATAPSIGSLLARDNAAALNNLAVKGISPVRVSLERFLCSREIFASRRLPIHLLFVRLYSFVQG